MTSTPIFIRSAIVITFFGLISSLEARAQTLVNIDIAQVLAAQCSQCHGMEGNRIEGFKRLNGESAGDMFHKLQEMKRKDDNDLMVHQIKGYTDQQLWLMADYFASQPEEEDEEDD